MKLEEQKQTQERFEAMFQQGHKPWTDHPVEPLFHEFFQLLSKEKPGTKILDVGCGDGWATIYAAQRGFVAWGIDSAPTGIAEAKREATKQETAEKTHFTVGDVLALPYEDGIFDAIIDGGLFHHIIPENRDIYFSNILRVMKQDAYFYLSAFSKQTTREVGYHFTPEEIEELFGEWFSTVKYTEDMPNAEAPFINLHFILKHK